MIAVGFTGAGHSAEAMRASCDFLLIAPTDDTPLIQQVRISVAHAICEAVEEIFSSAKGSWSHLK
jgi:D-sedoheptulose 7-phosphate isomerase